MQVGAGADALAQAGIVGDLLPLRIRLNITDAGSAKVSEALQTLLGEENKDELPARFVREHLGWRSGSEHGSPLELERLREVREAASTAKVPASADQPAVSLT